MQPGIVHPNSFPIRDPRDSSMKSGRVVNPPRYQKMGELSGPGKWGSSDFGVEAPTRLKVAKEGGERI